MITLKNSKNQDCTGTICKISFSEGRKNLEVEFETTNLSKGEQLTFSDSFATENVAYAVKSNAIRKDNDGYYILQLVKETTSLGEKLFAKRFNIYIGITVGEYTEITDGVTFLYPVITNPEVRDGMEIRIY